MTRSPLSAAEADNNHGRTVESLFEQRIDQASEPVDQPLRERGLGTIQQLSRPLGGGEVEVDPAAGVAVLHDEIRVDEAVEVPLERRPGDADPVGRRRRGEGTGREQLRDDVRGRLPAQQRERPPLPGVVLRGKVVGPAVVLGRDDGPPAGESLQVVLDLPRREVERPTSSEKWTPGSARTRAAMRSRVSLMIHLLARPSRRDHRGDDQRGHEDVQCVLQQVVYPLGEQQPQ